METGRGEEEEEETERTIKAASVAQHASANCKMETRREAEAIIALTLARFPNNSETYMN